MSQDPNNSFLTPVGRIVGGSVHTAQTKGHDNLPLETPKFVIMVAFAKTDPATAALKAQIERIGAEAFVAAPHQVQRPDFSWKITDGDSVVPNQRGIVPSSKEGYPGHFVLTFSTTFAFQTCGQNPNELINAAMVQTGFWVRVAGDIKGNASDSNPGVYLNLKAVQFMREDTVIQTGGGITAADAFGGGAQQQATPPVPGAPPAAAMTPPVPGAPPAPPVAAHDIVNNVAGSPPVPGVPSVPAPPVAPTGPVLTPKGVADGCVPATWIAGGQWTEALLRTNGYIQ